jgi:hypothetical protein
MLDKDMTSFFAILPWCVILAFFYSIESMCWTWRCNGSCLRINLLFEQVFPFCYTVVRGFTLTFFMPSYLEKRHLRNIYFQFGTDIYRLFVRPSTAVKSQFIFQYRSESDKYLKDPLITICGVSYVTFRKLHSHLMSAEFDSFTIKSKSVWHCVVVEYITIMDIRGQSLLWKYGWNVMWRQCFMKFLKMTHCASILCSLF